MAALIAGSPEYVQSRGGGTDAGFLGALFQDALQRPIDAVGQAGLEDLLARGQSRQQVAAVVFGSGEYRRDLVRGLYPAYLHRTADAGGVDCLVRALGQGMGDEDVLAAVLGSDEYFARIPSGPVS